MNKIIGSNFGLGRGRCGGMQFGELKKHLAAGNPFPAYTVWGNDRYLVTHAKKLLAGLAQLPELNVNVYDASAPAYEVVKACTVMPMLSDRRVVMHHGLKSADKTFETYLADPAPDSVLVFFPAVAPSKCGLDKRTEVISCDHLDAKVLASWIEKEAPAKFDSAAKERLIEYTMGDLARIETETAKLTAYAGEQKVTAALVETMVARDAEFRMYELNQQVAAGRADAAYAMLASILCEADPLAVLKSLNTHFRNLLHVRVSRVSEEEIASSLRVKTWALKHLRAQAKLYTPVRLKAIVDYFAECDLRVKTGAMTSAAALDNALLKVFAFHAESREGSER